VCILPSRPSRASWQVLPNALECVFVCPLSSVCLIFDNQPEVVASVSVSATPAIRANNARHGTRDSGFWTLDSGPWNPDGCAEDMLRQTVAQQQPGSCACSWQKQMRQPGSGRLINYIITVGDGGKGQKSLYTNVHRS